MMVVAIIIALYEQSMDDGNIYIMVLAIVVFMFGMMRLSAKTPSKNQDKEDQNV